MNDKLSIRKTAAKMKVNQNTAFLLRHKVLDCISERRKNIKLKGVVEVDETYESINLKGTKAFFNFNTSYSNTITKKLYYISS